MARKIEVQLVGDSRRLQSAFSRSQSSGGKWANRMKAIGKTGGIALAAGIGLGVVALKKSFDAAKEAEISQGKLRTQLKASGISYGKYAKQIDRTLEAQSKLSAFDDEELADSFTNIVRVTGDVNKSLKLNALVADVARGKNISLEAASKLVTKVAAGQVTAFNRQGIVIDKNATAQEALRIIQKKFAGQAKSYGDSTAGAQERFAVATENLQEKIGAKLLPVLAQLAEWGVQFMEWAQENWPRFSKAVSDAFEKIRPKFEEFVAIIREQLVPAISEVVDTVGKLWARFGDDIKRNLDAAFQIVKAWVQIVIGVIRFFAAILRGDWSAAWDALKSIARNALKSVVTLLRTMVTNVAKVAKRIGNALKDGIVNALKGLAGLVGSAVRAAINAAIDAFNALADFKIDPPGPGSISVNFPDLPHIASGGDIARTGMAVVHRGERVIPASVVNRGGAPGGQFALVWAGPDFISWMREQDQRTRRGSGGRGIL